MRKIAGKEAKQKVCFFCFGTRIQVNKSQWLMEKKEGGGAEVEHTTSRNIRALKSLRRHTHTQKGMWQRCIPQAPEEEPDKAPSSTRY